MVAVPVSSAQENDWTTTHLTIKLRLHHNQALLTSQSSFAYLTIKLCFFRAFSSTFVSVVQTTQQLLIKFISFSSRANDDWRRRRPFSSPASCLHFLTADRLTCALRKCPVTEREIHSKRVSSCLVSFEASSFVLPVVFLCCLFFLSHDTNVNSPNRWLSTCGTQTTRWHASSFRVSNKVESL